MDDVLPRAVLAAVVFYLPEKVLAVAKVQLDKADASVRQVFPAAGGAYGGPYLHVFFQGMFYEKTAYEAAGTGDEDGFFRTLGLHGKNTTACGGVFVILY